MEVSEEGHAGDAGEDDDQTEDDDCLSPAVSAEGKRGVIGMRRDGHRHLSRKDAGKVCADAKEAIETGCILNGGHLIGKSPKEHCHDDRAPHLRHDVKEGKGPVAEDGDQSLAAERKVRLAPICSSGRMEVISKGVEDKGKEEKKEQKDGKENIKKIFTA